MPFGGGGGGAGGNTILTLWESVIVLCFVVIPAFFFRKIGYINFVSKSVCPSVLTSVRHVSCKCISS